MKKLILTVLPLLLIAGCKNNKNTGGSLDDLPVDITNLGITCPVGAPAYAFYNEANNPNFQTNGVPANIIASMTEAVGSKFVVIDTNSGVNAIKNGAPYKIAASLTFGNFFIAATGNDDNDTMDPGDSIVMFGGTNGIPNLLFHYLYGDTYDSEIKWVNGVSDAAPCLISGKYNGTEPVKYVFIAQPALTTALSKNANASVYVDVQEAYKTKSGGKEMVQASIFVKNVTNKRVSEEYLAKLRTDVEAAVANPDVITEAFSGLDAKTLGTKYGVDPAVAVAVLKNNNGLGLGFKPAWQNKENIDAFLHDVQGSEVTSEEIYFK